MGLTVSMLAVLALGALVPGASDKAGSRKSAGDDPARRSVLPGAAYGVFVPAEANGFVFQRGYGNADTTNLVGYTFKATGRGYSSNIETMVGVDLYGRITGMKIVSHGETPGVGSKIAEVKPPKSALDVLRATSGTPVTRKVPLDLKGAWKGIIEIENVELMGELEQAVACRDTARVVALSPQVMAADWGAIPAGDDALTYRLAQSVIKSLREDVMPWWQVQFVGKSVAALVLAKDKSDKTIQAITGATLSSRAVTESVRNAMVQLAAAVGGFRETKK
jgi:Na+-translocating ferredoxin:NAD+ oxidoreductase RnfG subunit